MLRTFAVISHAVKSNYEKIFAGCDSLTSLYVEDVSGYLEFPYHFKSLKYLYSSSKNFKINGMYAFSSDCNLRIISGDAFDDPRYTDDPEYTFWAKLFKVKGYLLLKKSEEGKFMDWLDEDLGYFRPSYSYCDYKYTNSDTNVITIDSLGNVKSVGVGTAQIRCSIPSLADKPHLDLFWSRTM